VPGGVRDVVETLPGGGSRTWVIEDAPRPQFEKGEWVSDGAHKLGPQARRELQANLTLLAHISACRLAVLVAPALPTAAPSRHAYGTHLLRSWLHRSPRLWELTSLLLLSPSVAEVLVAPRCSGLLSESHALHFSRKATEILRLPPGASGGEYGWLDPRYTRLEEAALKLSFYVAFMFRSRAALSMLSMRFLSLAMMLFMLASMNAAKREQQRRLYALHGLALHGYDEHGRPLRRGPLGSAPLYASLAAYPELGVRREAEPEAFWDSFESGRRGRLRTYDEGPHGLLLQILALDDMLTRLREGQDGDFSDSAAGDESDEDDRRSPSPDR